MSPATRGPPLTGSKRATGATGVQGASGPSFDQVKSATGTSHASLLARLVAVVGSDRGELTIMETVNRNEASCRSTLASRFRAQPAAADSRASVLPGHPTAP